MPICAELAAFKLTYEIKIFTILFFCYFCISLEEANVKCYE